MEKMDTYIDTEGVECKAIQLTGPTILNTLEGERCGETGQWALYSGDLKPVLVDEKLFDASFTKVEK